MINSASASVILVLQLSVTGHALRALGLRTALITTPAVATLSMAGVSVLAVPETIAAAEVARKVLTYALARPAREVLFTVLTREQKYGAKVFLDTVVQRVGDASAAAAFATLVPGLGLGPRALPLAALPICMAWGWAAFGLGSRFHSMVAAQLRLSKSSGDAAEQGASGRLLAGPASSTHDGIQGPLEGSNERLAQDDAGAMAQPAQPVDERSPLLERQQP